MYVYVCVCVCVCVWEGSPGLSVFKNVEFLSLPFTVQFTLGVVDPASGEHPGWTVRSAMVLVAKHVAAGTVRFHCCFLACSQQKLRGFLPVVCLRSMGYLRPTRE
jgi:hypothetical protein